MDILVCTLIYTLLPLFTGTVADGGFTVPGRDFHARAAYTELNDDDSGVVLAFDYEGSSDLGAIPFDFASTDIPFSFDDVSLEDDGLSAYFAKSR